MKKLIVLLAAAMAVSAVAHDEEEMRERIEATRERMAESAETMRERMAEARARMADAAKDIAVYVDRWHFNEPGRAVLGVLIADHDETGVHVGGVTPHSGADEAGIVAKDVIVGIDGVALTDLEDAGGKLREVLDEVSPGADVELLILRDGETKALDVTTSAYMADAGFFRELPFAEHWADLPFAEHWADAPRLLHVRRHDDDLKLVDAGADLGAYFGVDAGVLVLDAPPKSELRPGDIVRRIDGADVASAEEAYRLLRRPAEEDAEEAAVEVRRKNRSVTVAVARPEHGRMSVKTAGPIRGRVFVLGDEDAEESEVEVEVETEAAEDTL